MQNVCSNITDRNIVLKERITGPPMHTHSRPILIILLIIIIKLLLLLIVIIVAVIGIIIMSGLSQSN